MSGFPNFLNYIKDRSQLVTTPWVTKCQTWRTDDSERGNAWGWFPTLTAMLPNQCRQKTDGTTCCIGWYQKNYNSKRAHLKNPCKIPSKAPYTQLAAKGTLLAAPRMISEPSAAISKSELPTWRFSSGKGGNPLQFWSCESTQKQWPWTLNSPAWKKLWCEWAWSEFGGNLMFIDFFCWLPSF